MDLIMALHSSMILVLFKPYLSMFLMLLPLLGGLNEVGILFEMCLSKDCNLGLETFKCYIESMFILLNLEGPNVPVKNYGVIQYASVGLLCINLYGFSILILWLFSQLEFI